MDTTAYRPKNLDFGNGGIQRQGSDTPAIEACDDASMTEATHNVLNCSECDREWNDSDERWFAFLDTDDEVALFCPACVAREFDNS
jgi:hypothetical protein